jgi:hypothetical protein
LAHPHLAISKINLSKVAKTEKHTPFWDSSSGGFPIDCPSTGFPSGGNHLQQLEVNGFFYTLLRVNQLIVDYWLMANVAKTSQSSIYWDG